MPVLIILAALAVIILVLYNSLIVKKNQVKNVFATIDVLLKKRYDLIPNLVATVQRYMEHEKETFTEITQLRAKAISSSGSSNQQVEIDNKISGMLRGIFVSVENYPELKANQNFLQLQTALNEIEEQLSAARRAYNAAVTDLNNAIEMFPTNILASLMNLEKGVLFQIPETEKANVNVKELFTPK